MKGGVGSSGEGEEEEEDGDGRGGIGTRVGAGRDRHLNYGLYFIIHLQLLLGPSSWIDNAILMVHPRAVSPDPVNMIPLPQRRRVDCD